MEIQFCEMMVVVGVHTIFVMVVIGGYYYRWLIFFFFYWWMQLQVLDEWMANDLPLSIASS